MNINKNTYHLFSPSGCLSSEAMKRIINSNLEKENLELAQNHINECELCSDAIEGIKEHNDLNDFDSSISQIKQSLKSSLSHNKHIIDTNTSRIFIISAAASVVILIGLFLYLTKPAKTVLDNNKFGEEISLNFKPIPPMPEANISKIAPGKKQKKIAEKTGDLKNTDKNQSEELAKNIEAEKIINKEPNYKAQLSELESSTEFSKAQKPELKIDELSKRKGKAINYSDIASNQPFEYYLAEIIVTDRIENIEADFTISDLDNNNPNDQPESEKQDFEESHQQNHFSNLVETMPEFPGGYNGLNEYLAKTLAYPKFSLDNNIQGRVIVSFIIEKNGEVTNADVLYGIGSECDKEALRVINSMPNWKPALQNGHPVKILFTLPIKFKIL